MVRKGTYFYYIQTANTLTHKGFVRPKFDNVQPHGREESKLEG